MGIFGTSLKTGGFMDEIRCDESSYLIWKWHPSGIAAKSGGRENAIRWGSSLRVKDGEVAIFVYKQKDGTTRDFIEGPFDEIIKTNNLPILASIVGLAYEGGTPFQAEVYFINLARVIQIKFGVPFFDIYDPRFTDFGVPVAVRGTVSFSIADYKEFIKLHRLQMFELEDFKRQIKDALRRYIKDAVINIIQGEQIPAIQIESQIETVNQLVESSLAERLKKDFGVVLSGIDIGAIEIDKDSENYHQLLAVTKNIATAKIEAETQDYLERMRIQREENQYALHKQTQTSNIGAFQIEKQTEVGLAGAEALGHMASQGAGDVNLGGGDGFNMASLMTSMAVGGAIGQNIAGAMNQTMGTISQPIAATMPPPLPSTNYHVVLQGNAAGPFNLATLQQMVQEGQCSRESLVWKPGMESWQVADSVAELKQLFYSVPPIPPAVTTPPIPQDTQ